jgi:hypothetical protein
MIIFPWIYKLINFWVKNYHSQLIFFTLFCFFVIFHFILFWKKLKKEIGFCRLFRKWIILLIIYLGYSMALVLNKNFFIGIDVILYTIFCGFLMLFFYVLLSKIKSFILCKEIVLIEIPISIYGIIISFFFLHFAPYSSNQFSAYYPLELSSLIIFLLGIFSLIIDLKIFIKKLRGVK